MKKISAILFFLVLCQFGFAQDSGLHQKHPDSVISDSRPGIKKTIDNGIAKDSIVIKPVKRIRPKSDSASVALARLKVADSLRIDSLRRDSSQKDSLKLAAIKAAAKKDSLTIKLMPGVAKSSARADEIFYILVFIIFFLGLVKTSFPKYFDSIFSLSFQATFRQIQTREQMAQNFFPAFMLNILFILCGGVFITLYAQYRNLTQLAFWELFVYATIILLAIYLIKYIVISFTGWVFNTKEAAIEYSFVVFLINKLLGVLLIPLLFLIAYANGQIRSVSVTIALCLIVFSLAVRYLVSLSRIRKNLSITAFHFFIYLCAVEIVPLLVIYKVLFQQTSNR